MREREIEKETEKRKKYEKKYYLKVLITGEKKSGKQGKIQQISIKRETERVKGRRYRKKMGIPEIIT